MSNPAIFIGEPLTFNNNVKIYPPTIREVVTNPNFNMFYRVLTLTQEDVQDEIGDRLPQGSVCPTPLEYILAHCQYTEGFAQIVEGALVLFCRTKVSFDFENGEVILAVQEKDLCITENNFFDFQNAIRESVGDKAIKPPEPFNPDEDPRITEIKRRARERDRIKAKQKGKDGISLNTCLVAICCMGIGITPLNIGEMSYAAIGEIMKMMQNKEKYDIDIRSLLAGADSKKIKPKYWIRNSDKE